MLVLGLMGDKALHDELRGLLATNVLRQTDTARHGAVDKHTHGPLRARQYVEHRFHQNPEAPHHQRGEEVHQQDFAGGKMQDNPLGVVVQHEMHHQYDTCREQVGIAHPLQIDERGVAQNPRIRMEHPRANEAQRHIEEECVQQWEEVGDEPRSEVKNPVAENSRYQQNDTVQQEDAPIRQCILVEVPIHHLTYKVHI